MLFESVESWNIWLTLEGYWAGTWGLVRGLKAW